MNDWAMWSELKLTQIRAQLAKHIMIYTYISNYTCLRIYLSFFIYFFIYCFRLECANDVQLNVKYQ